jgi:hypothetical protein
MRSKVIRINFKNAKEGGQPRMSQWTREELRAWAQIEAEPVSASHIFIVLLAIAFHFGIFFGLQKMKKPHLLEEAGKGNTARVTITDGSDRGTREKGIPEPQAFPNKPADAPVITGPSTSQKRALPKADDVAKIQPSLKDETKVAEQPKPQFGALKTERPVKVPDTATNQTALEQGQNQADVAVPEPKPEETPQATGIGFSEKLKDLLPNSKSEFVASQRRIGSTYGKGAVGGDIEPESAEPVGYKAPDKGKVSVTRYDYASYFMALDRRFTDAWGGTRVLPRGSTFQGVVGEFIEYDIIINRNGTLSKIVNVTQKKQKARDFSAVDNLVNEVFSHVFPMNPVPDRIKEDPLILRKRIQFTGYQYFMF